MALGPDIPVSELAKHMHVWALPRMRPALTVAGAVRRTAIMQGTRVDAHAAEMLDCSLLSLSSQDVQVFCCCGASTSTIHA